MTKPTARSEDGYNEKEEAETVMKQAIALRKYTKDDDLSIEVARWFLALGRVIFAGKMDEPVAKLEDVTEALRLMYQFHVDMQNHVRSLPPNTWH
jgi:hypothetical protein